METHFQSFNFNKICARQTIVCLCGQLPIFCPSKNQRFLVWILCKKTWSNYALVIGIHITPYRNVPTTRRVWTCWAFYSSVFYTQVMSLCLHQYLPIYKINTSLYYTNNMTGCELFGYFLPYNRRRCFNISSPHRLL